MKIDMRNPDVKVEFGYGFNADGYHVSGSIVCKNMYEPKREKYLPSVGFKYQGRGKWELEITESDKESIDPIYFDCVNRIQSIIHAFLQQGCRADWITFNEPYIFAISRLFDKCYLMNGSPPHRTRSASPSPLNAPPASGCKFSPAAPRRHGDQANRQRS